MRLSPTLMLSCAAAIALPAAAQQVSKPIRVPQRPIVATPAPLAKSLAAPTFDRAVRVARPGKKGAAAWKATLSATSARFKRPRMIAVVTGAPPGITRLNGATSGVLEPGGDYEISGRGFGTANGSVLLRVAGGRQIPLRINHWSDTAIYAHVPDDISGLPDSGAELMVGPSGKPPYKSAKFGFRAARQDIDLRISDAMFRHEYAGPTSVNIGGRTVPVGPPALPNRSFDGKWYMVSRVVNDGDEKRCIVPGRDRIDWGSLKNGYEVTSYYYERMAFNKGEHTTPRGAWAFAWEGNSIRIDFGVMRSYVPRYALIGGDGGCTSHYKINLVATGPRGVSPL